MPRSSACVRSASQYTAPTGDHILYTARINFNGSPRHNTSCHLSENASAICGYSELVLTKPSRVRQGKPPNSSLCDPYCGRRKLSECNGPANQAAWNMLDGPTA